MNISISLYREFLAAWKRGDYAGQRSGQAFYNHFNLHKMVQFPYLHKLYEADGEAATDLIMEIIDWEN